MKKKQKFDNRLFDVDEAMEVLSIYYGVITIAECVGREPSRYPKSWQMRTLIRVHRTEYSSSPYGLGYGYDWKGEKIVIQPDGSKKLLTSHAIKKDLLEYVHEGRIPGYAMKIAAEHIRFAATIAWMMHRAESITCMQLATSLA